MYAEREDTARLRKHSFEAAVGPREYGALTVLKGPNAGALFTLEGERWVIGRAADAEIPIGDSGLSRHHACIQRSEAGFFVEDMGSTNGTFVDGYPVDGVTQLVDGSRVEVGETTVLGFALHDAVEHEAAKRTHELTVRDPLTGLLNRRNLAERLDSEVAYARRHDTPLSVMLLDIDDFKRINDTYGHEAGDCVLRGFAIALEEMTRTEDVLARFGGEEFIVLARNIDRRGAAILAERLRSGFEQLVIRSGEHTVRFTASVGVAFAQGGQDYEARTVLAAADAALYEAKERGRNRVQVTWSVATRNRPSSQITRA